MWSNEECDDANCMKILPNSSNDRCGLLNSLFHNESKTSLYEIPENAYDSYHSGRIQNVINCETYANWASNPNAPYFTIQLFQVAIKPNSVVLTRRNNVGYPKVAVLEGYRYSQWTEICRVSFSFSESREVSIKQCRSSNYFTQFRFRQIENSGSITYIELDSFDIFGELIYIYDFKKASARNCPNSNMRLSIHILIILTSYC